MKALTALQMRYDLSPTLARILHLLVEHKIVTAHMVEIEHKITKDTKVAIHRLRRRDGVPEIYSKRDIGYWLDDGDRKAIHEAITADCGDAADLPFDTPDTVPGGVPGGAAGGE